MGGTGGTEEEEERGQEGGGPSSRKKIVAAPQGPVGKFAADDWACPSCGNVNWMRRKTCNLCGAPKPGVWLPKRWGRPCMPAGVQACTALLCVHCSVLHHA